MLVNRLTLCESPHLRRRSALRGLFIALLSFASTSCLSSAGGGGSSCEQGAEACECYGNGTCDTGLSCRSNLCVDVDGASSDEDEGTDDESEATDADDATDDTDSDNGEVDDTDAESTDGEAETESEAQSSETDGSEPSPGTDVEAATDTPDNTDAPSTTDPTETEAMDTDVVETDVSETDVMETDVSETEVTETMATETEVMETEVTETDPPEETDVGSCVESGSCSTGGGVECVDDVPEALECSGCGLLSCGIGCCHGIDVFAADISTDYEDRTEMVTTIYLSDSYAFITADFTGTRQFAAVAFNLDQPYDIDPNDLLIDMAYGTNVGYITVSLENNKGESGCAYDVLSGEVIALDSCWGDYEISGQGAASQINVRMHSIGPYVGEMIVYGVSF